MMKHCGNCANYDRQRKQHTDVCAACIIAYVNDERQEPSHWKCIPMTNGDRIRAMTDEELAHCMIGVSDMDSQVGFCQNLPKCEELLDTEDGIPSSMCEKCLLKWLQHPVEDL